MEILVKDCCARNQIGSASWAFWYWPVQIVANNGQNYNSTWKLSVEM
jgi:hypothetical protein